MMSESMSGSETGLTKPEGNIPDVLAIIESAKARGGIDALEGFILSLIHI